MSGEHQPRVNYWEIDALKGLAMLCVLLIHALLFRGTVFYEVAIDRAVPVLLVLFGVSSELSFGRHSGQSWLIAAGVFCRARLARLMPPMWAAVAACWLIALCAHMPRRPPAWPWLGAHVLGYAPQLGPSWFITLIIQLVLLFPVLRWLVDKLGLAPVFGAALAAAVWSHLHAFDVVDWMRAALLNSAPVKGFWAFYYLWIFAPAYLALVVAGMQLARARLVIPRGWAIACGLCFVAGSYLQRVILTDSFERNALKVVLDVPLTFGLLALLRAFCPVPCRRVLCWLGRGSWGIYLGQLVLHHALQRAWFRWLGPSVSSRWLYFGCLLLAGVAWVIAERALRRWLGARKAARAAAADVTATFPGSLAAADAPATVQRPAAR